MAEVALTLGSASPRRHALLASVPLAFDVLIADLDERIDASCNAAENAGRLASAKFDALANERHPGPLLTADTLVACGGRVLAKPVDLADARRMLHLVSGQEVEVVTALCFGADRVPRRAQVSTSVRLRTLADDEIDNYVTTDGVLDKAGALSLQDTAGPFIDAVDGCWSNVVGLPLCAVTAFLDAASHVDPNAQEIGERCTAALCGHPHTTNR